MPAPPKIDVEQLVAALAQGDSVRTVAKTLGVNPSSVSRLARRPDVAKRVLAERKRLAANAARDQRRVRAKLRERNDPGISAADRPELAGPVRPFADDDERAAYERASEATRRVARTDDSKPGGLGARSSPGRGSRRGKQGGRVLKCFAVGGESGGGGFRYDGRFERTEAPRDWLLARSRMRTLRAPDRSRTMRVQTGTEEHAELVADGWR